MSRNPSQFQKTQDTACHQLLSHRSNPFICLPEDVLELRRQLGITSKQFNGIIDRLIEKRMVKISSQNGYVYIEMIEQTVPA